jgi:Tfp pilus assembly protein PilO
MRNFNAEESFQVLETELQVTKSSLNHQKNICETYLVEWKTKQEYLERENAERRQEIEQLHLQIRSQDSEVIELRDLKNQLEEMTRRNAESQ